MKLKKKTACYTDGKGFWSTVAKKVNLISFDVYCYEYDEEYHGGMNIYFCTSSWNVDKYGLIYTDEQFMNQFREILKLDYGFTSEEVSDVDYSEQGMQGRNYVSCDIGEKFLRGWKRVFGVESFNNLIDKDW